MAMLVFPRISTISLALAVLPKFGFWIIVGITLIVWLSSVGYWKLDLKASFIGAVASIFAPCMIVHDHYYYYYVINYTGSILLTILSCVLPCLIYYESDIEGYHIENGTDYIQKPAFFERELAC